MNVSTGTLFYKPEFRTYGQIPVYWSHRISEMKIVTENVRLWISSRSTEHLG